MKRAQAKKRGEGYEVATATDGVEAIELARAAPFDFVLLDLVIPRMDGLTPPDIAKLLRLCDDLGRHASRAASDRPRPA